MSPDELQQGSIYWIDRLRVKAYYKAENNINQLINRIPHKGRLINTDIYITKNDIPIVYLDACDLRNNVIGYIIPVPLDALIRKVK